MRIFGSILRTDADRQGFWYSAGIGVFIGLLIGSAFTSILGLVHLHSTASKAQQAQAAVQAEGPPMALKRGPLAPAVKGFVDQNGKSVTTQDLLGKVRIVTFLSPLGNHYSPLVVSNLMNLYQELHNDGLLGKHVVFVSYNVDPAHTGPSEMSAFIKQIAGLNPMTADWRFLTADLATMRKLVTDGYGVRYRQIGAAEYAKLAAAQRQHGEYLYATAVNPLASQYKPDYHVVDHDEMVIVGPRDHIWARIPDASSYSNGDLMRFIATLLKLPGMPGANQPAPAGSL